MNEPTFWNKRLWRIDEAHARRLRFSRSIDPLLDEPTVLWPDTFWIDFTLPLFGLIPSPRVLWVMSPDGTHWELTGNDPFSFTVKSKQSDTLQIRGGPH